MWWDAAAENTTSVELFKAVSAESCTTPIIKPIATTCMAISLFIPNKLQAKGISNNEPPATPEAPQAEIDATTDNNIAVAKLTSIFKLYAAAKVNTVIVIAAPAMLMVAPKGIDTE
jgi:hypothetical protein